MRWFGEAREGHLGRGIVSFAGDVRQKRPHRDPLSWSYLQEAKTVILDRLEVVRKSLKKQMRIEQMEMLRMLFEIGDRANWKTLESFRSYAKCLG